MYLREIDRFWLDTPFLRQRFLIRSTKDIAKLRGCGIQEITIDTERGLDEPTTTEIEDQEETLVLKIPHVPNKPIIPLEGARFQGLPQEIQGISLG